MCSTPLTKLANPPMGNPSIITASSTPISTPSSRALVATIPSKLPEKASLSILRRSCAIKCGWRTPGAGHKLFGHLRPESTLHDRTLPAPKYPNARQKIVPASGSSSPRNPCVRLRWSGRGGGKAHQFTRLPDLSKRRFN